MKNSLKKIMVLVALGTTMTTVNVFGADGTVIQNMTTNSVAINCETRDAKFYDRESNSWK